MPQFFFFTEIEREIRTTEEVTTLKTYKYEEYYTQPSYQGDADDKTIKNNDGRLSHDEPPPHAHTHTDILKQPQE